MQDIADRLGISKVSVSKAMNGKPGVSDALRRQIFSAARDMGYEFLPPEAEGHFAFVVAKSFFLETDAFYSEMYYQFNKICLSEGISTSLVIVGSGDLSRNTLPAQLQMEEFSGIAVAGELPDEFLRQLERPGRPMVLLDFDSAAVKACAVLTSNYEWAGVITQLLVDRGHRKIGFIGQPGSTHSITDRYFGYRRTLLLNNLPFREEWVMVNNDTHTGLYTSNISLPEEMPTAFVCHCDMAAYYLLGTLNQAGLSCPEDISVISFDNTRLAETCCPPLTSVGIDTRAFARKGLELLLGRDRQEERARIYLPATLVERRSVKNVPPADAEAEEEKA